MRVFRIFRRKRYVWVWIGYGDFLGASTGPFDTKLDALLAGPGHIPDFVAELVREKR